ncbi:hypothetical protein SUGI_0797080 [Cryptomeria japonica]|uniref:uncharacterized protein LOC131041739 n=1 Tax=Cryptomeria japonica TaxID=3369 RepID=UPI0024149B1D|nr:uncharacterized protein LOC131041739 [Cryptomeria japonica]GLJ39102.1 hypothetical protein SUGI_0797080 [Cryptomeria japonica]
MATPAQPMSAAKISPLVGRSVAFRGANNKYLGWYKGGFLRFCYDDLTSPLVKHELVEENGDNENGERHVHIKCCFNQKFWMKEDPESALIVADGSSSSSCTLFRLVFHKENAVRLHLVQQNEPLAVSNNLESYLFAHSQAEGLLYAESLDILPQYVAFKGDNGSYLGCATVGPFATTYWLQFNAGKVADPNVPNEVEVSSDGIQIRHLTYDRYWKRMSDTYVAIDPDGKTGETDHHFKPVLVDEHTVALLSLGNNLFCSRWYSSLSGRHYLCPWVSTIDQSARLTVEEPVVWRRVHSIHYDLDNVEISDSEPVVLQTLSHTNTSSSTDTYKMIFSRTVKNSRTWSNSVACTTGVSGSFTLAAAETLGFGLQVSAEESRTMNWGETEEEEITFGGTYSVTAKPDQKVIVNLMASEAKVSVPFSYTEEDLLVTGQWVLKNRNDGLFRAVNHINLEYVASLA